jgi:uncharacterized protein YbjQ (UPF0145 family)
VSFCAKCGAEIVEGAKFCEKCGVPIQVGTASAVAPPKAPKPPKGFVIVTTPTVPGYRVIKVLGVVTGLTPRTRGIGGKIVAGFQSMIGGEVTAFTVELEKARAEAIDRVVKKAQALGANGIVGLDMETSDVLQSLVVISATGTAVVLAPANK